MKCFSISSRRFATTLILTLLLNSNLALPEELRLDKLSKSISMTAIHRSDNGRSVGMGVTLGNSFLRYRAFHGQLLLRYVGTFDGSRLPLSEAKFYRDSMDEAGLYHVENGDKFLTSKAGGLLPPLGHMPTFVTLKRGLYVDGRIATWVCIFSTTSIDRFYETRIGHERCDAFR